MFLHVSTALAQEQRVYGSVLHNGAPVACAKVTEIDTNYRILNQTYTNEAGLFTLKIDGKRTSLRVTAPGMRRFTQKIGKTEQWKIEMREDKTPNAPDKVKARHESNKIFVGRINDKPVAQLSWVEQLTDTTYTLVLPVRVPSLVEDYPVGRKMVVTNFNGHIMAVGECIEQAIAEEGLPKSWDPFIHTTTHSVTDGLTSNGSDYFVYPRFSFTKDELEYMIDHSTELAYFAVDTSRGDNYWMYYPAYTFAKELQKILNRMLK